MINSEKIQPFHLQRQAYIYVRQSSHAQVQNNLESQRCQFQLVELAKTLGWPSPVTLAEDLGVSASGCYHRVDFENLSKAVCQEQVGIILSFDVSRLARNGRDWTRLLEFCNVTHTLLADFQGVYDPKLHADDRLILGLKGTLSEVELESIKTRLLQARKNMASRGELFTTAAIGYIRSGKYQIRKDPDDRVQHAIALIFEKFFELRTVHKVFRWICSNGIEFPHRLGESLRDPEHEGEMPKQWKVPSYGYLRRMLRNPCYAGVYAYGKTESKIILVNGRKRIQEGRSKPMKDWDVLIRDQHEGYITWQQYEEILETLEANHSIKQSGAPKEGYALLSGLLRCGNCYQSMSVHYNGEGRSATYFCRSKGLTQNSCLRCNALEIDHGLESKLLEVLSPLGMAAALKATHVLEQRRLQHRKQMELELQALGYEVRQNQRRYERVDPDNRLVASKLEKAWNDSLEKEKECQAKIERFDLENKTLTERDREQLMELGKKIAQIWRSPKASWSLKKELVRSVLERIIVKKESGGQEVTLIVYWKGDDHTAIKVASKSRRTDPVIEEMIEKLSGVIGSEEIARLLNRNGKRTAKGLHWTGLRVKSVRETSRRRKKKTSQTEMVSVETAAAELEMSESQIKELVKRGVLKAHRVCKWAPLIIEKATLGSPRIERIKANPNKTQPNLI